MSMPADRPNQAEMPDDQLPLGQLLRAYLDDVDRLVDAIPQTDTAKRLDALLAEADLHPTPWQRALLDHALTKPGSITRAILDEPIRDQSARPQRKRYAAWSRAAHAIICETDDRECTCRAPKDTPAGMHHNDCPTNPASRVKPQPE